MGTESPVKKNIRSGTNSPSSPDVKPEAQSNFFLTGVNVEDRDYLQEPQLMPELDRELDVSDKIDAYKVIAVVDSAKTISHQDVSIFSFKTFSACF